MTIQLFSMLGQIMNRGYRMCQLRLCFWTLVFLRSQWYPITLNKTRLLKDLFEQSRMDSEQALSQSMLEFGVSVPRTFVKSEIDFLKCILNVVSGMGGSLMRF